MTGADPLPTDMGEPAGPGRQRQLVLDGDDGSTTEVDTGRGLPPSQEFTRTTNIAVSESRPIKLHTFRGDDDPEVHLWTEIADMKLMALVNDENAKLKSVLQSLAGQAESVAYSLIKRYKESNQVLTVDAIFEELKKEFGRKDQTTFNAQLWHDARQGQDDAYIAWRTELTLLRAKLKFDWLPRDIMDKLYVWKLYCGASEAMRERADAILSYRQATKQSCDTLPTLLDMEVEQVENLMYSAFKQLPTPIQGGHGNPGHSGGGRAFRSPAGTQYKPNRGMQTRTAASLNTMDYQRAPAAPAEQATQGQAVRSLPAGLSQEEYERRKVNGLCFDCGEPFSPGHRKNCPGKSRSNRPNGAGAQ